jgi:hypothetical protein
MHVTVFAQVAPQNSKNRSALKFLKPILQQRCFLTLKIFKIYNAPAFRYMHTDLLGTYKDI